MSAIRLAVLATRLAHELDLARLRCNVFETYLVCSPASKEKLGLRLPSRKG